MFRIKTEAEFDAAHFLNETNTQCDVLHGHRWKVIVTLKTDEFEENQQTILNKIKSFYEL